MSSCSSGSKDDGTLLPQQSQHEKEHKIHAKAIYKNEQCSQSFLITTTPLLAKGTLRVKIILDSFQFVSLTRESGAFESVCPFNHSWFIEDHHSKIMSHIITFEQCSGSVRFPDMRTCYSKREYSPPRLRRCPCGRIVNFHREHRSATTTNNHQKVIL